MNVARVVVGMVLLFAFTLALAAGVTSQTASAGSNECHDCSTCSDDVTPNGYWHDKPPWGECDTRPHCHDGVCIPPGGCPPLP